MKENKLMQIGRQFHKDFFEGGMEQAKQNLIKQIDMDTQENNKLIAEFIGVEKENGLYLFTTPMDDYKTDTLYFDTSWDWLMPVVEKIREITTVDIHFLSSNYKENNTVMVKIESINACVTNTIGRTATYQAVVEFIKEYNK